MRVVVTGGAGFIGSAVCRHFIADLKHDVVVVDKLTYAGNMASLAPVASSSRYAFEKCAADENPHARLICTTDLLVRCNCVRAFASRRLR